MEQQQQPCFLLRVEGEGFSTSWVTRFSTRAPVLLQCEVPAIPCKDGAINVLHKCLEVRLVRFEVLVFRISDTLISFVANFCDGEAQ